ncbi:MAG: hypothetical protein K8H88_07865, partial [Sandaracinaceae bacterium]|nr:hypothetical protein [Sandaracinaceae bacterium]
MTRSRTARSRTAGSGAALPAALISALRALRRGRYRSALERFSDYLGMNDGIETTERQWTPPLPPAELAAAVDELPLTPDLASFYAQVGGVTLRWTCSDAGITGALCIRPLPKVLRGLVFEASPDAWFKESARSKPFDLASNDSVTRLRLLRNEPDGGTALALEHEHRLASSSGVATLMRSDDVARPLDAYLELVLLSRGFLFWQQVWLIAQSLGGPPKTPSLEETRLWRAAVRAWPDLPFAGLLAPLGAQRSDTTATFECAVRSVVGRDVVLEIAPTGAWGDLARPDAAALLE